MRVARLDDEPDVARGDHERRDDGVAAGHGERAARQEVVLDVDGDERRLGHGGARRVAPVAGAAQAGRAARAGAASACSAGGGLRVGALALGGGVSGGRPARLRRRGGARPVAHDLTQQRLASAASSASAST